MKTRKLLTIVITLIILSTSVIAESIEVSLDSPEFLNNIDYENLNSETISSITADYKSIWNSYIKSRSNIEDQDNLGSLMLAFSNIIFLTSNIEDENIKTELSNQVDGVHEDIEKEITPRELTFKEKKREKQINFLMKASIIFALISLIAYIWKFEYFYMITAFLACAFTVIVIGLSIFPLLKIL